MESKQEASRVLARESEHVPCEVIYESGQLFEDIKKIKEYLSEELFYDMLKLEPEKLTIVKVKNRIKHEDRVTDDTIEIIYSRLIKHREIPDETIKKDWSPYYGPVKNQGRHDICWAIVAVELVTAIRWIKGRGKGTEYSYKELVEFVCPKRGELNKDLYHFCYKLNIMSALKYIIEHGVQEAADRPFDWCNKPPRVRVLTKPSLGYIGSAHRIDNIEEALIKLQTQPLGAAMPIFQPDYDLIKGGIYRGPTHSDSAFKGIHAVSVTGAGVENGESFLWVRSSHGTDVGINGYFRVSIDVMIHRASKGQEHESKYFLKPTPLLDRFCYAEVLDESEEKKKIEEMSRQFENMDQRKVETHQAI